MPLELNTLIQDNQQIEIPQLAEDQIKKINKIRELFNGWRTWFETNHKERIRENYRRYNNHVDGYDDVEDEWRGINGKPIRMAIEYAVAETYKTQLLKAIISNPDLFKILPTKKQTVENAKIMEKTVKFYLNEDEFERKAAVFIDQITNYGSAPWLVYQKQKRNKKTIEREIKHPQYAFGLVLGYFTEKVQQDVWETFENRPSFEVYDIENVAFDYTMGRYEDSPYYIFRVLLHRSKLKKMFPEIAEYFDSPLLKWSGTNDYQEEKMQSLGKSKSNSTIDNRIEVLFYLESDGMVVTFGDKIIIEYPNQTKAKKKEVFTGLLNILPKSFEAYGLDLITLTSPYADMWNEIINNSFDSAKLASSLMTKIKKNSGVEMDTIYTAPGNQWLVENMEDVEEVKFSFNPAPFINILEYIGQKDQQITGATNVSMGTPSGAQFAVDIQRMVVESNKKFWLAAFYVKLELKRIVRAYVKHIQEYVAPTISPDNPLVFAITGEKGFDQVEINNPLDLEGDYDYKISFEIDDLDKNLIRAQLIQAVEIISKNPALAQYASPPELIKLIFKMFPDIKELENLGGDPITQLMSIIQKLNPQQLVQVLGAINGVMAGQEGKGPLPNSEVPSVPAITGSTPLPTNMPALTRNMVPTSNIAGGNIPVGMGSAGRMF